MKIQMFFERDSFIIDAVRGKRVLHLGCVGYTDGTTDQKIAMAKQSLHAAVTDAACECNGVDLDDVAIADLRDLGIFTNVIHGDVEKLNELREQLGQYDVVLAGDIIEHLSNPGLMLNDIKMYMKSDGILIVSTPNSFGIASWIKYARGIFHEGAQHVICFNPITLKQLLNRHGYRVVESVTCYQSRASQQYGFAFRFLRAVLQRIPRFGGTLLYVCRLD